MSYTLKTVTFRAAEPQSTVLEGPADAARILLDVLEALDQDREHFMVLALNARGRVIGYKVIATGTANACLVHPREVFRTAIALGAVTVIVAHNHPSGEADPSPDDRALTQRLIASGELVGIPVVDSIIITATGCSRSIM